MSLAAAQIAVLTVAMLAVIEVAASVIAGRPVRALATLPNGTRILYVPMSWCVVRGTPAAVAPNVTSEGTTVADTNTDAVMWRRHERPTDNGFLPQASVSLRSSINNSWGTLNFPLINDPDNGGRSARRCRCHL
jgi:heme O synthase-like polyprenyltransferase